MAISTLNDLWPIKYVLNHLASYGVCAPGLLFSYIKYGNNSVIQSLLSKDCKAILTFGNKKPYSAQNR